MVVDLLSLLTQPSVVAVCGVEVVAEGAEGNVRIVRVVIIVEGGHRVWALRGHQGGGGHSHPNCDTNHMVCDREIRESLISKHHK